MEVCQGMCECALSWACSPKGRVGLAGRVPSFRPRQIRHDRRARAASGTEPIRLQAVPTASEPRATQIWCDTSFEHPMLSGYSSRLIDVKGSAPEPAPTRGYPGAAVAQPGITFDRFVRACVAVKQLSESFTKLDGDRDGWIQLSYESFMETVLLLP
jgi:hypothetical protein